MVYDNIKEISEKKNMSIREVERKASIGNGVIGSWRTSSPNMVNLQKVANALGVSVSRLLK